jgi:hypothetical protein
MFRDIHSFFPPLTMVMDLIPIHDAQDLITTTILNLDVKDVGFLYSLEGKSSQGRSTNS